MVQNQTITGRIHSFQSLGTVDGPGVRTVVFMQGCPLRCICCHNPDTWDFTGGTQTTAEELVNRILRYRNYFGEQGGVTVSGGEPLCQTEFVTELFCRLRELGISTALDTAGYRLDETVKALLDVTDLVLLDYKYTNARDYLRYTGCEMARVDAFLAYLQQIEKPTWLRHVLIPGYNDSIESLSRLHHVRNSYSCVERIELLPFRKLCLEKYRQMSFPFPLEETPEMSVDRLEELRRLTGL